VKISIDDFGTGYSSLSYLKKFSVDELKIDRVFVSDITLKSEESIVNAILAMAASLGLDVVAEGVENIEQYQYLASHNCDFIQGYMISKPIVKPQLDKLIHAKL
jgi:EAL domain-containing protein (putative c-di-GMP-specific phosphodiesterase class I)